MKGAAAACLRRPFPCVPLLVFFLRRFRVLWQRDANREKCKRREMGNGIWKTFSCHPCVPWLGSLL